MSPLVRGRSRPDIKDAMAARTGRANLDFLEVFRPWRLAARIRATAERAGQRISTIPFVHPNREDAMAGRTGRGKLEFFGKW